MTENSEPRPDDSRVPAAAPPAATPPATAPRRPAGAARQEARRSALVLVGLLVLILALVGAGTLLSGMFERDPVTTADPPRNLTDGAIVVGDPGAPITVAVYEDLQCPWCKRAHEGNKPLFDQLTSEGRIRVEYHMMAFLGEYSTRALNAIAAVRDVAPESFGAFHDALYREQPTEGGPGLNDDRLVQLAVDAGAPESEVRPAIEDLKFKAWTEAATRTANEAGVNGTPTVFVNGTKLESGDPETVKKAIEDALDART